MEFSQYENNTNLNCVNETDQFSVTNSKAKLTYPIGLLTEPERGLIGRSLAKDGKDSYWGLSPDTGENTSNRVITGSGDYLSSTIINSQNVRPVITLKPTSRIEDCTGTYTDPYVVGPVVVREN